MTTLPLDSYIVDTLMAELVAQDRRPSAFLVYLLLWRCSIGAGEDDVELPPADIATATGLSTRAVEEALRSLQRRGLLSIRREGTTAVPVYTVRRPWMR